MASQNRNSTWIDFPSREHQDGEFTPSALIDSSLGDAYEALGGLPFVRASSLPVTAYTAGDTKDPGFKRLETPVLAQNPSRIRRRYTPLRREDFSGFRSPDPVFPSLDIDSGRFAYPVFLSRPTTLMELFQDQNSDSSEYYAPALDDDLVPVDAHAAMLARQMGLAVHGSELQSIDTNVSPFEDSEEPLTSAMEVSRTPMPDLVVSSLSGVTSDSFGIQSSPYRGETPVFKQNSHETSLPTNPAIDSFRRPEESLLNQVSPNSESVVKTSFSTSSAVLGPQIGMITDPSLSDLTTTDTHLLSRSNFIDHQMGAGESSVAAQWNRDVIPGTEVEMLKESLQQSRQQIVQMESRQQESERIAVSRAEKRIRDRLRVELPPPPPEEVSPESRGTQVLMKPISESLDSTSLVPDPLEAPVTVREMQIIQQQQAINESAMRQQIVKELRNDTEHKIERAQQEADTISRKKLKAALSKIINS